ncbi:MAG: hypothetical protein LBE36_01980 [Flavobacteriaceae bacterium]|nr:hypothetical protein [Flavobacteriaceae bacterium]
MMENLSKDCFAFYKKYIQALKISTSQKKVLLNSNQADYNFYHYYPYLFQNAFPKINDRNVKLLSVSGYLYFLHLTIFDQIIDEKNTILIKNVENASFCQEESVKILSEILGQSKFWGTWYKRKRNFYNALHKEKFSEIETEKDYLNLVHLKSEMGKCAIDALHALSKFSNEENYKNLLLSHDNFSKASQIIDDVQDLIEDYENGQQNWILQIVKNSLDNKKITINKINIKKELYSTGIALKYYKKADYYFKKAHFFAEKTGANLWCKIIKHQKLKNENRINTLIGFNETIKLKIKLKKENLRKERKPLPKLNISDIFIKNTPLYLLNEHNSGYTDLKHFMYLSDTEGFDNKQNIHIGEVFQLGIITDILIDIQNALNIDLQNFICENIEIIKNNRLQKGVKGWSYFSSVSEIAPDIDDLGQVIQCLYKSNETKYVENECVPLIDFAVKNCSKRNGGILTWLIPKENPDEIQQKQKKFNTEKWGEGPDVEVVANFIYSVQLLNKKKHEKFIEKNILYIIKNQSDKGFWKSRWYYGNYYGTYVAVRSICKKPRIKFKESLDLTSKFLLENRNEDGGWGLNPNISDPLNTAFAILTLKLIDEKRFKKVIENAKNYLHSCQAKNNSWDAVNFIKPRMNDPYKSSTMTTAYVLKALI